MGLFSRKKSTSITDVDDTSIDIVDNRIIEDSIAEGNTNIVSRDATFEGDINIEKTDHGTVQRAFDFASESVRRGLSTVTGAVSGALRTAQSAATDDSSETMNKLISAAMIIGVVFALRGVFKK